MKRSSLLILGAAIALPLAASAAPLGVLDSINCPGYAVETREYEVSRLNPPAETVGGISFPGQTQVLFRGTVESNMQFDLEKSIRGMMNEKNWFVGSPMFFGIAQVLSGAWDMDHSFFPSGGLPLRMREYFRLRGLESDIETLLRCRAPGSYTRLEAESLASNLMNKVFWNSTADAIQKNYFHIDNPEYYRSSMQSKGLGNNAVDFIIASAYDQVAAIYGKKILVLKDTRDRGLDLGFWNYKHNGKWWHSWVDNGEINIPGYIRTEDLLGFQMRKKDRNHGSWGSAPPDNEIDYALYRADVSGEPVILVLDGGTSLCIVEAPDHRYYPCVRDDLAKVTKAPAPYPRPESTDPRTRTPLLGVITTCDSEPCATADAAFKWYEVFSKRHPPSDLVAQANSITVDGKRLRFTPVPAPIPPPFSGVKIVSATYMTPAETAAGKKGNVTDRVAAFVDGKDRVDYQVMWHYLGIARGERSSKEFVVEWICAKNPGGVQTRKINAPAEGQTLVIDCP